MLIAIIVALLSCKKDNFYEIGADEGRKENNVKLKSASKVSDFDIATTNQSNNYIEIYNNNSNNWGTSNALLWSWKPNSFDGYTSSEISAWNLPSGVRLRNGVNWGGRYILATSSGGLVTIASYPFGTKKWALNVGGNPHEAELLPNGNIAIAASTGNYIRVYASSQGSTNGTYASFTMDDAHGVLWDPSIEKLWVIGNLGGQAVITALTVGGTDASPSLSEATSYRDTLPTSNPHYLAPYYGDINKLWISSGSKVYIYSISTRTFTEAPGNINRVGIKGVTNQPSGYVLLTRPDNIKNPMPPDPSTLNTWTTSYVDYYSSAGVWQSSGHRVGASWYKGVTFWPEYQYDNSTDDDCNIITTNQYNDNIEIYDFYSTNWDSPTDLLWSWKPNIGDNFTSSEIADWDMPNDAKIRNNSDWGVERLVATSSGGLSVIVDYPDGTKKWALDVGGNPLSAELLSNGNIVIANSTSDWVRVYASSQGYGNSTYASVYLDAAKCVLWDSINSRLWAIGSSYLKAYSIGGTAANPTITEDTSKGVSLPSSNGGYIAPYYNDNNRLWVTTGTHVYVYNKTTKSFTTAPGDIDKSNVKAISHQPSGYVVLNRPDASKTPTPSNPSTLNSWTTSYIDVYTSAGKWQFAGHKTSGASYYRGIVINSSYQ